MHLDFSPNAPILEETNFATFLEVDIRAGEVIEVLDFPEARNPSYKLKIDFGEGVGVKKTSAQITALYSKKKLLGRKILAVVNFPPRQIGKFMSEVLVLGLSNKDNHIVLLSPDGEIPKGARLH